MEEKILQMQLSDENLRIKQSIFVLLKSVTLRHHSNALANKWDRSVSQAVNGFSTSPLHFPPRSSFFSGEQKSSCFAYTFETIQYSNPDPSAYINW